MDGPASYVDRADAARVLVGVFVVALPLVCMTIVAAVMITPTTVWGDWQWRLPGVMRMLETMLRWRTVPLSICGLCAAAMTVGLLVEWRDAWHRFEQCHPLEDGDCSAIVAMAPLSLTVAFSTAVTSSCCFVAGWYRRGEPRVGHKARRSRRMSASGNTATARAAADRVMAALQSQMGSLQQAASSSTTTGSGSGAGGGKAGKSAGSGGARRRKR